MRHFLRDDDLTPEELLEVLDLADVLKADRFAQRPLEGPKTVALLFDKSSTRTRVSFAVGIADLGGQALILDAGSMHMGRGEPLPDTARVLGRMTEAIVWRTYAQADLEEMAAHAGVPVVNSLSDDFHPCQILADWQTIREHKGSLAGLTVAYVGDGANNMGHSYVLGGANAGMNIRIGSPTGYQPNPDIVADAVSLSRETGGSVTVTDDPVAAVADADVVITDTWISMGQEGEKDERLKLFGPYSVSSALLSHAKPDAIVLHCLPAYRGVEIAAEVIDGPQSVVWDEAENRLHAQKALLAWLLERA